MKIDAMKILIATLLIAPATLFAEPFRVENPLDRARQAELIEITTAEPGKVFRVVDEKGAVLPQQWKDRTATFIADFEARQSRTFRVEKADSETMTPQRTFGRFVPERLDDFAWENDRIAFRVYGPALEKSDPAGSGIDVWCKRTTSLIIDQWYKRDDYHHDNGEGLDGYKVGHGRGCGGSGIWQDRQLLTTGQKGYASYKILEQTPLRFTFELLYPTIEVAGEKIRETKRVTLCAGENLNRIESVFHSESNGPIDLIIAVGLSKHADRAGNARLEKDDGWIRYADPSDGKNNGTIFTAAMAEPSKVVGVEELKDDLLLLLRAKVDEPVVYFAGAGWDKSGQFKDLAAWDEYLLFQARRHASPLVVTR